VVPITCVFFYYTEPQSMAVKAQIVFSGTGKRDYRNTRATWLVRVWLSRGTAPGIHQVVYSAE
jgi:hypothetical protein